MFVTGKFFQPSLVFVVKAREPTLEWKKLARDVLHENLLITDIKTLGIGVIGTPHMEFRLRMRFLWPVITAVLQRNKLQWLSE